MCKENEEETFSEKEGEAPAEPAHQEARPSVMIKGTPMLIQIDQNKCKKDKLCIRECPTKIIQEGKNGFPEVPSKKEESCIECGHCIAVCPTEALSFKEIKPESLPTVSPSLSATPAQVAQLLKGRRSIRQYKPQAVEHELLEKVLDLTRWAPSAVNFQPLHWLIIEDRKELNKIIGLVVEFFRVQKWMSDMVEAWEKGEDLILRGASDLVIVHAKPAQFEPTVDAAIALTYLELAAYTHGLGTCWAGIITAAAAYYPPLLNALKLPEGHKLYGAMMIGYPQYRHHKIPDRHCAKITYR